MAKDKRQLGQILLEQGKIDAVQLEEALEYKREKGVYLGKALVALELLSEEDLINAVSDQMQLPTINPTTYRIQSEALRILKEDLAKKFNALPLFQFDNSLTIAVSDPNDIDMIDEIIEATNMMEINLVLATESSIVKCIELYYSADQYAMNQIQAGGGDGAGKKSKATVVSQEITEDTEIIEAVDMLIEEAVKNGASDIHVEPREKDVRMRFRVDGVLQQYYSVPKSSLPAIVSRIKILSDLDIAEARKPQDGRFRQNLKVGRHIDLRTSTFPTPNGEKIVMRILDGQASNIPLQVMGFDESVLENWIKLIHAQNGLVLVTGPTGSGKTTSLYASLNMVNSVEVNIMTVEDPIEYPLDGITQGQVNEKAGVTFSAALRSMLRQDPDIILVGEMRDKETTELAVRAALTGHLCFSTLHTNDASSSYTRILNMGLDAYLISSTIRGILAQRLVRVLCDRCKEQYEPTEDLLDSLNIQEDEEGTFFKPIGCTHCKNTGYKGRAGVYELLIPNTEIEDMVIKMAPSHEIERVAVQQGMVTLSEAAKRHVLSGKTSYEEVMRVSLA